MNNRTNAALPLCALAAVMLSACGGGGVSTASLWPFGGDSSRELSRIPANSIAYQCEGGKRFYLRYLDNGAAAWVILPEREFRLDKIPGGPGVRYGSGKAVLSMSENAVTLSDGPTVNYAGCRIPSAEPAAKPETKPAVQPTPKPAAKP